MRNILLTILVLINLIVPAHGKTLEELTTGTRYLIEENKAYYFDSSEVYFFINESQRTILDMIDDRALLELTNMGTYSVTLNINDQTLPTDYYRIVGVALNGIKCNRKEIADVWAIMPGNDSGEDVSNTTPFYLLYNNALRIYPIQTSAGTYEVNYLDYPTALVAVSDECDLSQKTEDLVIIQAAIYLLLKDHEFAKASALREQLKIEVDMLNSQFEKIKKTDQ